MISHQMRGTMCVLQRLSHSQGARILSPYPAYCFIAARLLELVETTAVKPADAGKISITAL
jgi:hypothetical protein